MPKLFTYGTLMRGQSREEVLSGSEFLGTDLTAGYLGYDDGNPVFTWKYDQAKGKGYRIGIYRRPRRGASRPWPPGAPRQRL